MAIIRAQVRIGNDSGLAADVVTNTLHFSGAAVAADITTDLHPVIQTFYSAWDQFLSSRVGTAHEVRYYDLGDPEPRTPLTTETLSLTPSTSMMADEVACCLSFQAIPVSGENQARRRGRIYLGPLGDTAGESSNGWRPSATFRDTVLDAADILQSSADTALYPWVIYSQMNDTAVDVEQIWMDNAWDTVRSRGLAPTSRDFRTIV